jgi:hypothetical protein
MVNFDKDISPNVEIPSPFSKSLERRALLSEDLQNVSEKIKEVKSKIEDEQNRLSYTNGRLSLYDEKSAKEVDSPQYQRLIKQRAQIEKEIENLQEEEKDLQDFQQEIIQQMAVPPLETKQKKKPLRKTLLNLIYPATKLYSPKALQAKKLNWAQKRAVEDTLSTYNAERGLFERTTLETEIEEKKAKRIAFYTEDGHKLDGCIVYGDPKDHNLKHKKMMVMALGNAFTWQIAYAHARLMAEKFGCNVLLYNPRGVGKSSGKTQTMHDAVVDCRAAISYALRKVCLDPNTNQVDAQKLGVYGHSLGGGVSAIALQELVKEGKLSDNGVGIYINHHSFSSLSGFVKGYASVGRALVKPAKFILSKAGHDQLEAKRAIKETKLASRVVIATGEKDKMMGKVARLKEALFKEQSEGNVVANQVLYVSIPDYGHHEEEEYLIDYDKMTKSSEDSKEKGEDDSENIKSLNPKMRAEKLAQLQSYHHAIEEWANS